MRFNVVFIILILAFFGTEIQARWSKIVPKSKNNQPFKILSTQKSTSKEFPFLPKRFQNKSIAEIYERYCQFILGASKECIKQYIEFNQVKPTSTSPTIKSFNTFPATLSTISSHPSPTKTEKMHGKLEKTLEFELEQVWKNREKRIKTTAASPPTTDGRTLAYIRIY